MANCDNSIEFLDISKTAADQLNKLDAECRRKFMAAFERRWDSQRCPPIKRLARYGVRHADVTDTLRIASRRIHRRECVIFVGPHPEIDKWVENYTGNLPQQVLRIKDLATSEDHPQQVAATVQPAPAAEPLALGQLNAAELFSQIVLESSSFRRRAEATDALVEELAHAARDEAVSQLSAGLQQLETRIGNHDRELERASLTLTAVGRQLEDTAAGAALTAELQAGLTALAKEAAAVHVEVTRQVAEQAGRVEEIHSKCQALAAMVSAKLDPATRAVAAFGALRQELERERKQFAIELASHRHKQQAIWDRLGTLERAAQRRPSLLAAVSAPLLSGWAKTLKTIGLGSFRSGLAK